MKHFAAGFLTASIVWIGVLVLESRGELDLFGPDTGLEQDEPVLTVDEEDESSKESEKKRGKKGRRGRSGSRGRSLEQTGSGYEKGDGETGDDVGAPGSREIGMGGSSSEEQLSEAVIDRGIDRVFGGIERCLVLVPADAPTSGKVVVGMHIASSGSVTKVNLKGPKALINGESGACIQRNVRSIKYPSFDGPDMVVHYPITFE